MCFSSFNDLILLIRIRIESRLAQAVFVCVIQGYFEYVQHRLRYVTFNIGVFLIIVPS